MGTDEQTKGGEMYLFDSSYSTHTKPDINYENNYGGYTTAAIP
jgi:hypothetical protein